MKRFLHNLFGKKLSATVRKSSPAKRLRLQLEQLDERIVPALVAVGEAIAVNPGPSIVRAHQAVAQADNNGNFAVAWTVNDTAHVKVYDSAGTPRTGDIVVGTADPTDPWARVAMSPDGNFVVAWNHRFTSTDDDIYLQRFHADGSKWGAITGIARSNAYESEPSVAMDRYGDIVVAYT